MKSLNNISHIYFVGIGGIGMSALARYLLQQGKQVAGYDRVTTQLTVQLEKEGIAVSYQDNYDELPAVFKDVENSLVIYTPAVSEQLELLLRFRESGITTIKRAQLLGLISKQMPCLAIAGTHGKTTTSAILAHLLYQSGIKVTAFLGGILEEYNSNFISSGTDVMVVEADEYDRSFLHLEPAYAGITSIDPDHLDIYGDDAAFEKTFKEFSDLVPDDRLLINNDVSLNGHKVGINNGDYYATDVIIVDGSYHFNLITPSLRIDGFILQLPGRHNLNNAVMALAMALDYGVDGDKLKLALNSFPGVQRRFTYRINTTQRVLIDDYAHHPTEIDAVYHAVTEMYPDEPKLVIFQPHLFSRTRDFMSQFVDSLAQFDKIALLDIYPAREEPIEGITAAALCKNLMQQYPQHDVSCVLEKEDIEEFINEMDTRIVVMLGAGDIGVEILKLTSKWQAHEV